MKNRISPNLIMAHIYKDIASTCIKISEECLENDRIELMAEYGHCDDEATKRFCLINLMIDYK